MEALRVVESSEVAGQHQFKSMASAAKPFADQKSVLKPGHN